MGFPGTWMTETEGLVYRVVPKCACSTIGQIMYFSDHGEYYDGDIHDAKAGIHKWGIEESQSAIEHRVLAHDSMTFTCVRNPYGRILSSFFDKIAGIQRNGNRYRGNLIPKLMKRYGIEVGTPEDNFDFDQIKSFRRFALFARDTIKYRRPMEPDIHWSAMAGHISTFIVNGGRYDRIITTENFNEGMKDVLDNADAEYEVDLENVPRFNESEGHGPKREFPISDYFDDLTQQIVWDIYKKDFRLFKYDFDDPDRKAPKSEIDHDEIHAKLGPRDNA